MRECENEIEKDIFSQLEGEDKEGIEIDKVGDRQASGFFATKL